MGLKPWYLLPAPLAHKLSLPAIQCLGHFLPSDPNAKWNPVKFKNLNFENPLGIAGGVDKDAKALEGWQRLGCGFIEIGTVTPRPQTPNPGKIIDRSIPHQALWNKMGFPNGGVQKCLDNICRWRESAKIQPPLFINVGKNRDTDNDRAHEDYIYCLKTMDAAADGFVVNISSPNTKGLRQLFEPESFKKFLGPVIEANQNGKPLLLKLSPDMSEENLHMVLDTSYELGVDGWIMTNTTAAREDGLPFPANEGGVSGRPLTVRSRDFLKQSLRHLGQRRQGKLIVSVGGIMTPDDAATRLEDGADLIQVYAALVFHGPGFFKHVARKMS